jgi:hypothetical protein
MLMMISIDIIISFSKDCTDYLFVYQSDEEQQLLLTDR